MRAKPRTLRANCSGSRSGGPSQYPVDSFQKWSRVVVGIRGSPGVNRYVLRTQHHVHVQCHCHLEERSSTAACESDVSRDTCRAMAAGAGEERPEGEAQSVEKRHPSGLTIWRREVAAACRLTSSNPALRHLASRARETFFWA